MTPHAACSYRLQWDENTVADAVASMKELLDGFSGSAALNKSMMECLEKGWSACEQGLFLLGFVLHPVHKAQACSLLRTSPLTWSLLSDFCVYYYRRFLSNEYGMLHDDIYY